MPSSPPAVIGMSVADVDTPALLLDLDGFESNVAAMAGTLRNSRVRLRPHAKSHKCPEISKRQILAGAIGICCQKVSEAEAMVSGGITDVLIANEVVGTSKIARVAALAKRARISICVDDAENAVALDEAARAAGVRIDVLVEVNVGADRCGVAPGEPAAHLARVIGELGNLRFAGIQAYHGAAQHVRALADRREAIEQAIAKTRSTRDLIEDEGLDCDIITGAGTGSFVFEHASGIFNELQPGSYVFMDADYGRNEWAGFPPFRQSLFLLTTVMSAPAPGRAVVDAGLKAHSVDSGMPLVVGWRGVQYMQASDEHGVLQIEHGAAAPKLGDKLRLVPGHCDPTVNLYDWLVCVRGDYVRALWPIAARGAVS